MNYSIGCDAHKRFSQFAVYDSDGNLQQQTRVDHTPGALCEFLTQFPKGTPVALETVGNWYWIVDEIETSGYVPLLTHAVKDRKLLAQDQDLKVLLLIG